MSRKGEMCWYNLIWLITYHFLLVFSSYIKPNLAPLLYTSPQIWVNLDLSFQGHPRSKVMVLLDSQYAITYWCFNSNTWSNSAPLRAISLRNLSDLDIYLSRSLRSLTSIKRADLGFFFGGVYKKTFFQGFVDLRHFQTYYVEPLKFVYMCIYIHEDEK